MNEQANTDASLLEELDKMRGWLNSKQEFHISNKIKAVLELVKKLQADQQMTAFLHHEIIDHNCKVYDEQISQLKEQLRLEEKCKNDIDTDRKTWVNHALNVEKQRDEAIKLLKSVFECDWRESKAYKNPVLKSIEEFLFHTV